MVRADPPPRSTQELVTYTRHIALDPPTPVNHGGSGVSAEVQWKQEDGSSSGQTQPVGNMTHRSCMFLIWAHEHVDINARANFLEQPPWI